jgi:hypothetical protein
MGMDLEQLQKARWPLAKAATYAERCRKLRGCNYLPRHSINPTAMWQALDEKEIDQELGWAQAIGLNSVRVFLQYLVYEADPQGLLGRMDRFLDVAARHGISVMFVHFDDCHRPEPYLGEQSAPIPGVHNSGWTQSPGVTRRQPEHWQELRPYVQNVLRHFSNDERILAWDLYNEPERGTQPLVEEVFAWAREVNPAQPLTTCWRADDLVDLATFHNYDDPTTPELFTHMDKALATGRPVLCTECMARTLGNTLAKFLPVYAEKKVGWYIWGFVSGASQTRFPWGWPAGGPEPWAWFHDLLYPDGTPYRQEEVDLIGEYARRA